MAKIKDCAKDCSDEELNRIGEMILGELNIDLYNAEPTIHKAYHIYVELIHAGYQERNKDKACAEIKLYFKNRIVRQQSRQFFQAFNIPFRLEMNGFLTLSYRTSVITEEVIKDVANEVDKILKIFQILHVYGVDHGVLSEAITELYNPRYYENEWKLTIGMFLGKIKRILLYKDKGEFLDEVECIFNLIDPSIIKKKRQGEITGDQDYQGQEYGDEEAGTKAQDIHKERVRTRATGPKEMYDDTYIHNKAIIKDSEVQYVKKILIILESEDPVSLLDDSLYENPNRHPVVTTFLNAVKTYNKIIWFDKCSHRETMSSMKVAVRALREIGHNIISMHEMIIYNETQKLLGKAS